MTRVRVQISIHLFLEFIFSLIMPKHYALYIRAVYQSKEKEYLLLAKNPQDELQSYSKAEVFLSTYLDLKDGSKVCCAYV